MLRSLVHLSEYLQTRPEPTEAEEVLPSSSHVQWAPRTKLRPGRNHYGIVRKPPKPIANAPREIQVAVTAEDRFSYSRKLVRTAAPPIIRLLKVLPAHVDDTLCFELQYVALDDAPVYEAISYCWEGQTPHIPVLCDGQPLRITENLGAAIKAIRHESSTRLIWADAVCIDQTSIEEKNCQVPLMRQIYQNAVCVHVWLGEDTPDKIGREAFGLFRELHRAAGRLDWTFSIFEELTDGETIKSLNLPGAYDRSWLSMQALIQRPWFARAWIIQEVVVSRRAVLHCGEEELSWKEFYLGFLFAVNSGYLSQQPQILLRPFVYPRITSLIMTCVCFNEEDRARFDLCSLLQNHRLVEATDPKDKIYALLGLAADIEGGSHGIVPDYSRSAAEIYTEVSKLLILRLQNLDLLGTPRTKSNPLIGDLPSWVVDWSGLHFTTSLSLKNLKGEYAFAFEATNVKIPKQVEFRGTSMIVNGHVFASIARTGEVMDPFNSSPKEEKAELPHISSESSMLLKALHIFMVLYTWLNFDGGSSRQRYPPTSESFIEAYFRTIYLDHVPQGYDVTTQVKSTQRLYSFQRLLMRTVYAVCSRLFRSPRFVNFVTWYETNRGRAIVGVRGNRDAKANVFQELLARTIGRRMAMTDNGYMVLAPDSAEVGDQVFLIKGSRVPLILRPIDGTEFELQGDCYVHGIMHGEGFEEGRCADVEIA